MQKIKVSEIFFSIQGEGRFVGVPSIFLRTFGCNFTCDGFGMPAGQRSQERHAIDPTQFRVIDDLPLVSTGCDSYLSWDPRFKHLSPVYTTAELGHKFRALLPGRQWTPSTGNDVHLVITGGEPLLGWQRAYPELLAAQLDLGLQNVTFETNGTQPVQDELRKFINDPFGGDRIEFTFSISPKLSASGEKWSDAVKPEVVAEYDQLGVAYLKFVVDRPEHFDEADQAVAEYRAAGFTGPAYVMPVGGVVSVYEGNRFNIAETSLARGYRYSPRLHVDIWGNSWAK